MNGQHLKRLPRRSVPGGRWRSWPPAGHDLSGRSPEWQTALVRAIGDRLKTLMDAERYGAFALREQVEMDEAAWAEVRERPEAGARLEALAARIERDHEFFAREPRARDARARGQARHQGGRAHGDGPCGADRAQGGARAVRGHVAAGARAGGQALARCARSLGGRDAGRRV